MEKRLKQLEEEIRDNTSLIYVEADQFTNEYDWEREWECFNPINVCNDAFVMGVQYAINFLKKDK